MFFVSLYLATALFFAPLFNLDLMHLLHSSQGEGGWHAMSMHPEQEQVNSEIDVKRVKEQVVPSKGAYLPIAWRDLGVRLTQDKVLMPDKLAEVYKKRGGLNNYEQKLLRGNSETNLYIDEQNAGVLLNLFWALGLANRSAVYRQGPMHIGDKNLAHYAATGGWSLAAGQPLDHFNQHNIISLSAAQEAIVVEAAKNIYRPCCNNATYFPDCNHGMAMLGLLELMVSQNLTADQIYHTAQTVNAYWFPSTYLNIARFLAENHQNWSQVDARQVLGRAYSSATGYNNIISQIEPLNGGEAGGCAL